MHNRERFEAVIDGDYKVNDRERYEVGHKERKLE